MAGEADPEEIQTPGLIEEDGHDLPISPARPAIHDELRAVLEAAPLGPSHALVRDRVSEGDTLCPMNPDQTEDTHLVATLMALFNMSPFLNFLEDAANKKAFDDPLVAALHGLAQSFRGWGQHSETEEQQHAAVESQLELVRKLVRTARSEVQPEFKAWGYDVPEFISYLFRRIEQAGLRQDQVGGDDVDLSVRFKQLFRYFNVRYSPMRCKCDQPVLRRQDTKNFQPDGFILTVEVPKSMTLAQAISRAMWEKLARQRICPECDGMTEPVHDFDKFAYLPEMLLVHLNFLDKSGGIKNYRSTTDEKLTYPENLDMSAFRDDPQRPGDQTDCIYKIQSVIYSRRMTQEQNNYGAYKAALRMNEDEFTQFQSTTEPGTFPENVTFEDLNEASNGVPVLLMYLRERHADAEGIPTDAVEVDANKPQSGTTKAVTPTPSQPKPQVEQSIKTGRASKYGTDNVRLQEFIYAQDLERQEMNRSHYEVAMTELTIGKKWAQWIWYIFPVVPGVSHSEDNMVLKDGNPYPQRVDAYYELDSLKDARAYWKYPLLKDRYIELVQTIRHGPEPDLDRLFGGEANAQHFLASLTLFIIICKDERYNFELFKGVFKRFKRAWHQPTVFQVARWAKDEGDEEGGRAIVLLYKSNSRATEGVSANHASAQRIGSKLLNLADQDFSGDDDNYEDTAVAEHNQWARKIGSVILGFDIPKNSAVPESTPYAEERARRLGRHIFSLAENYHSPEDDSPEDATGVSALGGPVDGFGLDGTSDDPDGGADLDDDLYETVAIPTDPHDPRIEACEYWTLDELKREFQKEQLDWRGLRADPQKHRMKFRKHFELVRDYSIYHEVRLRQAIRDRGIRIRNGGNKVDKAELVDALTNYDAQKLQGAEYVDEESEDTESDGYESEPYQSSEASGTEAWYVERERAALSANGKGGATTVQPRAAAAAARARKRPRDADEEDDYDDGDEDDEELMPRAPTKGPVRMRTRY